MANNYIYYRFLQEIDIFGFYGGKYIKIIYKNTIYWLQVKPTKSRVSTGFYLYQIMNISYI